MRKWGPNLGLSMKCNKSFTESWTRTRVIIAWYHLVSWLSPFDFTTQKNWGLQNIGVFLIARNAMLCVLVWEEDFLNTVASFLKKCAYVWAADCDTGCIVLAVLPVGSTGLNWALRSSSSSCSVWWGFWFGPLLQVASSASSMCRGAWWKPSTSMLPVEAGFHRAPKQEAWMLVIMISSRSQVLFGDLISPYRKTNALPWKISHFITQGLVFGMEKVLLGSVFDISSENKKLRKAVLGKSLSLTAGFRHGKGL